MEIIVGKYSGFCNGVNYTVTKANEELDQNGMIYSLGEIVHNESVTDELKRKGLLIKNNLNEIPDKAKVIIRAHGESIDTYKKAKEKNLDIIDLTCGKVRLIHHKILKHQDDNFIIIIGKKDHPETIAHKSYSNNSFIVENKDDVLLAYEAFLKSNFLSIYIVSQTTFNELLFNELVGIIQHVFKDIQVTVDNTICNVTSLRQLETVTLAKKASKMIIVGGVNSSNTKELYNIAKNYCKDVYLIRTYYDLDLSAFKSDDIVGIMGGASTPQEIIDKIVEYVKSIYKKVK